MTDDFYAKAIKILEPKKFEYTIKGFIEALDEVSKDNRELQQYILEDLLPAWKPCVPDYDDMDYGYGYFWIERDLPTWIKDSDKTKESIDSIVNATIRSIKSPYGWIKSFVEVAKDTELWSLIIGNRPSQKGSKYGEYAYSKYDQAIQALPMIARAGTEICLKVAEELSFIEIVRNARNDAICSEDLSDILCSVRSDYLERVKQNLGLGNIKSWFDDGCKDHTDYIGSLLKFEEVMWCAITMWCAEDHKKYVDLGFIPEGLKERYELHRKEIDRFDERVHFVGMYNAASLSDDDFELIEQTYSQLPNPDFYKFGSRPWCSRNMARREYIKNLKKAVSEGALGEFCGSIMDQINDPEGYGGGKYRIIERQVQHTPYTL